VCPTRHAARRPQAAAGVCRRGSTPMGLPRPSQVSTADSAASNRWQRTPTPSRPVRGERLQRRHLHAGGRRAGAGDRDHAGLIPADPCRHNVCAVLELHASHSPGSSALNGNTGHSAAQQLSGGADEHEVVRTRLR
jgi:hypothetical protein